MVPVTMRAFPFPSPPQATPRGAWDGQYDRVWGPPPGHHCLTTPPSIWGELLLRKENRKMTGLSHNMWKSEPLCLGLPDQGVGSGANTRMPESCFGPKSEAVARGSICVVRNQREHLDDYCACS